MCKRNGNPKRSSRFLCVKHLGENYLGAGIQRGRKQREKYHIKDLYCLKCKEVTKCIEIRWCDTYDEIKDKSKEIHDKYYPPKENNNDRKRG